MASLRDIRQKIKSVTATQQITNAMKMMSTAKLSRAIEAVNQSKTYITKLLELARNVKSRVKSFNHPALEEREVNNVTTIIIGGERGLCAGFNQELHNFALEHITKEGLEKQHLYVIGKKPIRFFQMKDIAIEKAFESLSIKEIGDDLFALSKELYEQFKDHKTDKVNIISTAYVSSVNHPITCQQLLPIPENSALLSEEPPEGKTIYKEFDFYPSAAGIFDQILPRYMYNSLLKAVLESVAAEQCARMVAMTSATDRANEKLEDLNLELNRSRQAQITQELNEVIAGSQTSN